jgi:hypothetical protein
MSPLRNDNPADTIASVRHMLCFMAEAFHAMASCESLTIGESASLGAAHIMEVCADALREDDNPALMPED